MIYVFNVFNLDWPDHYKLSTRYFQLPSQQAWVAVNGLSYQRYTFFSKKYVCRENSWNIMTNLTFVPFQILPVNVKALAGSLITLLNWFLSWITTFTFNFAFRWSATGISSFSLQCILIYVLWAWNLTYFLYYQEHSLYLLVFVQRRLSSWQRFYRRQRVEL